MVQQRQGSHDIAAVYLHDAYAHSETFPSERASAAHHLGLDGGARGEDSTAARFLEESLDLRRLDNLTASIPASLLALADAVDESQRDRAGKLIDEAVEIARSLRVRRPLAVALCASGRHHVRPSELAESRSIAVDLGDRLLVSVIDEPA